ncbi:MAG: PKD domain-containing protein [Planctomycetales bacterium]|nr:PKD domain-containing protein [bacterium]UNM08151.1 MAG: PKD domain-containing protein [Planctomycetales bacterium]
MRTLPAVCCLNRSCLILSCTLLFLMFVQSCGNGVPMSNVEGSTEPAAPLLDGTGLQFPADRLQPWEERSGSVVDASSEFLPGRDWYLASVQGVSENGEAARLAGGSATAHVIYRLPLADQPGVLGLDANPAAGSSYFAAVADQASGRWRWFGPFRDSHVRLPLAELVSAGADFRSALGNMFIAVLVRGGDALDVVAIGANPIDGSDSTAPQAPAGFTATPVAGGLALDWMVNSEPDLAGYQLYYSAKQFINPQSVGVQRLPYLLGSPAFVLEVNAMTYLMLQAVDISGNGSQPTELLEGAPLPGSMSQLSLQAGSPSGTIGEAIPLTASGAQTFDWDLDGDGVFEVLADEGGIQQAYTGSLGIIRPAVRASDIEGTAVALGSVSLLISGNSRPVAVGMASPAGGTAPLIVDFSGTESTDFDGVVVGGGWDFDGDGTYDVWDDTDILHVTAAQHTYTTPGTYNARLRVLDDDGSWDVDTLAITVVEPDPGPENLPPVAMLLATPPLGEPGITVDFDASGSFDPDGSISTVEWDLDGNGVFGEAGAEDDNKGELRVQQLYLSPGLQDVSVRITDDEGAQSVAGQLVKLRGWKRFEISGAASALYSSPAITVIGGHPAITYRRATVPSGLFYAYSSSTIGDDLADWTSIDISLSEDPRSTPDIAQVAGHPAIACYDSANEELLYYRSTTALGLDAADWEMVLVDTLDNNGNDLEMAVVNGKPAIAYTDSNPLRLKFAFASTVDGMSASDWDNIDITTDASAPDLGLVSGEPAIVYQDTVSGALMYAKSSTADGQAPVNWLKVVVDTDSGGGSNPSLAVINGFPSISYYNASLKELRYAYATNENAQNALHWQTPVVVADFIDEGKFSELLEYGDAPAAFYYSENGTEMMMAFSNSRYGRAPEDWESSSVDFNSDNLPQSIDAMVVNGYLVVVYTDGQDDITYGILID